MVLEVKRSSRSGI